MLDLYKLEIFVRVADEGSFSRAAEQLLMTQPGVSQHIKDLERSLGTTLFKREQRGVKLIQAGSTLYPYAQKILSLVAEAEEVIVDVAALAKGRVSLAATPGVSIYILAELIQTFGHHYPKLSVSLETEITPRVITALQNRRLDFGIVEGELTSQTQQNLGVIHLEDIEQYVVVGQAHPFWVRGSIAAAELNDCQFIMRQQGSQTRIWLDEALKAQSIQPHVVAEFDNLESIKRSIMAGRSIAILPQYAVQDEQQLGRLKAIAIDHRPFIRTLKLIWNKRDLFSPVSLALLRHLAHRFPSLVTISNHHY